MSTTTPLKNPIPLHKTKDLQLSTIYVVSGIRLCGVERVDKNCLFVFEDSEKINELTLGFYSGTLRLNPKDVFEVWRGLRSMAYRTVEQ